MNRRRFWLTVIVSFVFGFALGPAWASHQWGCYEWAYSGSGLLTLRMKKSLKISSYNAIYDDARSKWDSTNTALDLPYVSSGQKITLYAKNYGFTGWLGLATIYPSGCTITSANCKLNNTYLKSYSTTAKKHVACQEVGHTFGLDHNRNEFDTCMNDTILNAPQPNQHDEDQLNLMY